MGDSNNFNHNAVNEVFMNRFNLPMQFINSDAITNTYYNYEKLESMAKWISNKVNDFKPKVAIICGSGLGEIAELVEDKIILPYSDIPEFPRSTVHGHKGNLVFGHLSDLPVVCMQGRFHPFEGYSLALCSMPVKIFKILGVKLLILTNAAGGVNPTYKVGDLMVLKDHISFPLLSLSHPLIGPNDERFGPRFVAINRIYSKKLRECFLNCGKELNMELHEGVYGNVGGPTYESPSDSLWCRQAGMDSVGMSTAHEAIVALYCGLKVLAFSIITDMVSCEYDNDEPPDHNEILKVANAKAKQAESLVAKFLEKIRDNQDLLN